MVKQVHTHPTTWGEEAAKANSNADELYAAIGVLQEQVMPFDYKTTPIKMIKNSINVTVAAGAFQKLVLDLGADWNDYKFVSPKGVAVTGQTATNKSISFPYAVRFCTDAAGTTPVEDFVFSPMGNFLTCRDWAAGTEVGYLPITVGPVGTGLSPNWVSTTQAVQNLAQTATSVYSSDSLLVLRGRYLVQFYKNTDTVNHTLTNITAFLHNVDTFI
jgi:hypothetical protein